MFDLTSPEASAIAVMLVLVPFIQALKTELGLADSQREHKRIAPGQA